MLIYSIKDTVFDTPAPGTETLIQTAGSLDNKRLSVSFGNKKRRNIHSNLLLHSNFIHENA